MFYFSAICTVQKRLNVVNEQAEDNYKLLNLTTFSWLLEKSNVIIK